MIVSSEEVGSRNYCRVRSHAPLIIIFLETESFTQIEGSDDNDMSRLAIYRCRLTPSVEDIDG